MRDVLGILAALLVIALLAILMIVFIYFAAKGEFIGCLLLQRLAAGFGAAVIFFWIIISATN